MGNAASYVAGVGRGKGPLITLVNADISVESGIETLIGLSEPVRKRTKN
jgi:hypothetical protein